MVKQATKVTNKHGYPEAIVKAIENDPYDSKGSDFTASSLIGPPRKRVLSRLHANELVEDVDDRIWSLFGQLGHLLLERAGSQLSHLIEERFFSTMDGKKISAQIDSLCLDEAGVLTDWKFTTVYAFKRGQKPKREWIAQLNIQKYLLISHGYRINSLRICGILRDWRPTEKRKDSGYPNKIGIHEIKIHSQDSVERFIKKRIKLHLEAEKNLPLCDEEDNWNWNRCAGYCEVSSFCDQYQQYLKAKGIK